MTTALAEPPQLRPILMPVASGLRDADLSVDELGSRIVGLAGRLAAATCRWLLLVARFDDVEGCARFGLPSTARWLSHCCGIAQRTALEHVRVARALAAFPDLAVEMGAGRLSYAQVRAISRVAGDGEDGVVAELIEVARHSTANQLETIVRGMRTVEHNETADGADRPEEYVSYSWSSQSQWRCQARLDPERGAVVRAAIDSVARAEGLSQADALVRMAEIALVAVNDSADSPRPLRGDERSAVVIHLDAAAVPTAPATQARPPNDPATGVQHQASSSEGDADEPRSAERDRAPRSAERDAATRSAERERVFARIADGPGLPARVVERLLCAGRIRTAVHGEHGNVRDLGRSHRVVSERQFRALLMKHSGQCAHPGCTSSAALEAHHVRHWLYGGRTDLNNLVLLCLAHHLGHHAGEFRIVALGDGRFRYLRHDGRLLEHHVDPKRLADDAGRLEEEFATVPPGAARTNWTGERLDRHFAVSVLAERRIRRRARENA